MRTCTYILLWVFLLIAREGFSQTKQDTGFYLIQDGCKGVTAVSYPLFRKDTVVPTIRKRREVIALPPRTPFLVIHGNVTYDLYYQSHVDTPYIENDVYQHTVQTFLDITVRNQYPLRVAFTTNMGNSSLFRNITGINLQYTNSDFKNMLADKARHWDAGRLQQLDELKALRAQWEQKANEVYQLKNSIAARFGVQQIVEAKERALYEKVQDSLSRLAGFGMQDINLAQRWPPIDRPKMSQTDTAMSRLVKERAAAAQQLDSLQKQLAGLDQLYLGKQKAYGVNNTQLLDVLMKSRNNKELADNLHAMNLPDTVLPKGYKNLLAIRSVGVGRTIVDYSELTAKDISILGVQAEYNPSYYVAFATGMVDYRFRNFIVNENRSRQYLNLIRVGTGMREGNNIIFTWYTGKKQLYNFNTDTTGTNPQTAPNYNIMGVSLEGKWQLNRNNYLVGEVAKSSLPYYARSTDKQSTMGSMLELGNRSNEAYSVSSFSFVPLTGTRINAMYKKMGANFQSFSLYTTGSSQSAWSLRVDQPFFRKQLTLSASIRQNDFTSLYQNVDYKTNTIFKSIQATLRIKKWPVVAVGYMPSSQLIKLSENQYTENLFYTLVGSVSHFYEYNGVMMNTIFSYTRFYNKQTDSNFVYFNSKNILLNHTVFLGKFTLNGSLSAATNQDYDLYGIDGNVQYKINNWLEIGGGAKYNRQTQFNIEQLGYSGNTRVNIPRLGEVSLMADKGFVPGAAKQLVPNNTGRLTYTKIF
ncbi:hypothetical protein F0L74_11805 [Chitinophaga agrisoli]|uniref:Uncharacterized protein n=1 Tax=Chitinophaga agrisoli TaxID=2607653 RepID=A0A5B2VTS5_9BACT|nr:hypothetical protein [Chitinophaga agrisoli]KAA2243193.1 hypothetical protein F0L74_11805 [Chitinophaga agrisoli]